MNKIQIDVDLFQAVFDNPQQGYLLLDSSGKVLLFNNRAKELLHQIGSECIQGKNFVELLPADLQNHIGKLLQESLQTQCTFNQTFPILTSFVTLYYEFFINPIPSKQQCSVTVSIIDRTDEKIRELEIARLDGLFFSLVNSTTAYLIRIDLQGHCTYANRAFYEKFGFTPEEVIGKDYHLFIHPEDVVPFQDKIKWLLTQPKGSIAHFEMRKLNPKGEYFYTDWEFVVIYTSEGKPCEIQGVGRDITDKKLAEMVADVAHKRFESIVDSTDGIVWELDFNTFCFTYVSQKAERLLGYPLQEWYQPNFWIEHLHPEDRQQALNHCLTCSSKLEPYEFEYRFIAKDRGIVWLRNIVIVVAEEGKPLLLRGIMIDVTRQKEAEQLLERLSLVAQRTFNGVILTDSHQRIVWANDGFTQITGYTWEEIKNKPIISILHSQVTDSETISYLANQLNNCQTAHCEIYSQGKDGRTYWLDVEVQPLFNSHKELTGFMAIQTNISQRKNDEAKIKMHNEVLKQIAYTQSHVLRRHVANILGLLQLIQLENGNKLAAFKKYFDLLLYSAKETDHILHRMVKKVDEIEQND